MFFFMDPENDIICFLVIFTDNSYDLKLYVRFICFHNELYIIYISSFFEFNLQIIIKSLDYSLSLG